MLKKYLNLKVRIVQVMNKKAEIQYGGFYGGF